MDFMWFMTSVILIQLVKIYLLTFMAMVVDNRVDINQSLISGVSVFMKVLYYLV